MRFLFCDNPKVEVTNILRTFILSWHDNEAITDKFDFESMIELSLLAVCMLALTVLLPSLQVHSRDF